MYVNKPIQFLTHCRVEHLMSASVSSLPASISNDVLSAAVAQLVRAAVDAQADLSARGIRLTLETEFACDLRARKDVIARAIQATLEEEARDDDLVGHDLNGAPPDAKRRKASACTLAGDEFEN